MIVIPKTSAPQPVDATLPRRGGAASGISLKGQPTVHSDPSAVGVPVRVRSAGNVPATHGQIRRQAGPGHSPPPDDAAPVAAVAQRLLRNAQLNPQLVTRWASLRAVSDLSDAERNEYTRMSCTIVKSPHVSDSEALSIALDAARIMSSRPGRP